jgi:minor extracellular serine protease Vpr
MFEDSWANSNHTVGSKPPFDSDDGKPLGTLYTSDQINAAIKGQLQIARTDKIGHGTACAGTAAGNDLGVAPEADLIIVDSHKDDPDHEENAGYDAVQAAQWIKQLATQRHQPCVISMSFGGQGYAHDGTGDEQAGLNAVLDAGEARGLAICMSAGNEGADSIHARGHFGPAIPGEINGGIGSDVQLFETKPGLVVAMFDARDDWQLYVVGLDKFLFGTDQKPVQIVISKDPGNTTNGLHFQSSGSLSQSDKDTLNSMVRHKQFELGSLNGTDTLVFPLPPGAYVLVAGGNSEKVTHGVFDLYLPQISTGSFGKGGDHNFIVGGPGDADHVITVGSYDFRNVWENSQGTTTREEQINLGTISAYSSPGFRRDGVVKPDIAGPGQFTISAYAQGSTINEFGPAGLTKDGKHVAWAGTSASTPYTAGVVALMLEKNPQLTANQVVQILHDTADHDFAVTGAVPNPQWGYGKLNPEKAIQKVSPGTPIAPSPQPSPAPPSPVAPSPLAAFVGIFKGDGLVMQLVENADQSFSGSMQKGGQTFMLDAHVVASHLEGSVHNNGNDFPFSATVDGDNLMVHAGEKDFNLTRTAQPAVGAGAH